MTKKRLLVPPVVAVVFFVAMLVDGQNPLFAVFTAALVWLVGARVFALVADVRGLPEAGRAVWRDAAGTLHYMDVPNVNLDRYEIYSLCGRHWTWLDKVRRRKLTEPVTCRQCRREHALGPPQQ